MEQLSVFYDLVEEAQCDHFGHSGTRPVSGEGNRNKWRLIAFQRTHSIEKILKEHSHCLRRRSQSTASYHIFRTVFNSLIFGFRSPSITQRKKTLKSNCDIVCLLNKTHPVRAIVPLKIPPIRQIWPFGIRSASLKDIWFIQFSRSFRDATVYVLLCWFLPQGHRRFFSHPPQKARRLGLKCQLVQLVL